MCVRVPSYRSLGCGVLSLRSGEGCIDFYPNSRHIIIAAHGHAYAVGVIRRCVCACACVRNDRGRHEAVCVYAYACPIIDCLLWCGSIEDRMNFFPSSRHIIIAAHALSLFLSLFPLLSLPSSLSFLTLSPCLLRHTRPSNTMSSTFTHP